MSTTSSQIDVELQRRHDLIPNLVASLFGFVRREFFELSDPGVAASPQPTDLP